MITIIQLASLYILTSVVFVYFLFELTELKARIKERKEEQDPELIPESCSIVGEKGPDLVQLSHKKKIPVVPIKGLLEHKETAADYAEFQKIKAVRASRLLKK